MHVFLFKNFPLWVRINVGRGALFALLLFAIAQTVPSTPALAHPLVADEPLRFINEAGQPLANAPLRLLCYTSATASAPTFDSVFTTNNNGQLQQALSSPCPLVAALQIIYKQPSGKPGRNFAYWVYATSWAPGTRNLLPATGDVMIRRDWPLVLFDVAATLEWEPAAASHDVAELRQGLQLASAYLFDLTEGQMAFGSITISTHGKGWAGSDLRLFAANDYRPSARVGGIVTQATPYITADGTATAFTPGEIFVGRYWDGFNAANPITGNWTQPAAYHTLAHEWLHYALFLYDEYQETTTNGRSPGYCTCKDLPLVGQSASACGGIDPNLAASAMAYHYTASELWLHESSSTCQNSDQQRVHGASDWATLARWSNLQGLPVEWLHKPSAPTPGPQLGLAGDLFERPAESPLFSTYLPLTVVNSTPSVQNLATAAAIQASRTITLEVAVSATLTANEIKALQAQVYTIEPGETGKPNRLLYQGTVTGPSRTPNGLGKLVLVGVQPGAEVQVYVNNFGQHTPENGAFVYRGVLGSEESQTIVATSDRWRPNLQVTPLLGEAGLDRLMLTLAGQTPFATPPTVQLCTVDDAIGCSSDPLWQKTLISSNGITWTTTLTAPPGTNFPDFGYLYLHAAGVGDLIRWFQILGNVGLGHRWGFTPLRDGLLTIDAPLVTRDVANQILLMPTTNALAREAALPPGFVGGLGSPFDIKIAVTDSSAPNANQLPLPAVLTFFFNQASADSAALDHNAAARLFSASQTHAVPMPQLLSFQPRTQQWQVVQSSGRSENLNWIATEPVTETGIYMVGQPVSEDFGTTIQLLTDTGLHSLTTPLRYLVIMPAASSVSTPTAAFLKSHPLSPFIHDVENINCNIGNCFYEEHARKVNWQGLLKAGDVVYLSFNLRLDASKSEQLPPSLAYTVDAFDGATNYTLNSSIVITQSTPSDDHDSP